MQGEGKAGRKDLAAPRHYMGENLTEFRHGGLRDGSRIDHQGAQGPPLQYPHYTRVVNTWSTRGQHAVNTWSTRGQHDVNMLGKPLFFLHKTTEVLSEVLSAAPC